MRQIATSAPIRVAVRWLAGVTFLCGLTLLVVAAWTRPLAEGDHARRAGRIDEARARYAAGESRFDRLPIAKQLLPTAYRASQANQVRLLYELKRYDAVIEHAGASLSSVETHFWAGCAWFETARLEEEPEARIARLTRAEEEFRQALTLEPTDWSSKYNYELTRRLLTGLRKQPQTPPDALPQLLRPQPPRDEQPVRRIG